jgi:catechol 2,3-dioxygenase-like lactoylglutathione lyase family enzyme
MKIQHFSAVNLAVQDMAQSVDFYIKVGLELVYGGKHSSFTAFRASEGYINLRPVSSQAGGRVSRVIVLVEEVDLLYSKLKENGLEPESPRDGDPGERFFYLKDPDGHELSFVQLLS